MTPTAHYQVTLNGFMTCVAIYLHVEEPGVSDGVSVVLQGIGGRVRGGQDLAPTEEEVVLVNLAGKKALDKF